MAFQALHSFENNKWAEVSVTDSAAMGVDLDGKVFSWGLNESCRLGPKGDTAEIFAPTQLIPSEAFEKKGLKATSVSCGSYHSMVLFQDKDKEHHLYSVGIAGGERKAPFEAELQKVILNGAVYCYKHGQEVPLANGHKTSEKCLNLSCKAGGSNMGEQSGWCPDSGYHCTKCRESEQSEGQCPQCLLVKNMKHFKILNSDGEVNQRL
jgi:hypothetical protein